MLVRSTALLLLLLLSQYTVYAGTQIRTKKSSIFINIAPNNLIIIRHEKGCRDRPGWINVIVWIDSFFELRCYGAMLWFSRGRDSWWFKISFSWFLNPAIWPYYSSARTLIYSDFSDHSIKIFLQLNGRVVVEANVPLEKGLRSTSQGKLNSTSRQQTSQRTGNQSLELATYWQS
jgi:hypothetical protein